MWRVTVVVLVLILVLVLALVFVLRTDLCAGRALHGGWLNILCTRHHCRFWAEPKTGGCADKILRICIQIHGILWKFSDASRRKKGRRTFDEIAMDISETPHPFGIRPPLIINSSNFPIIAALINRSGDYDIRTVQRDPSNVHTPSVDYRLCILYLWISAAQIECIVCIDADTETHVMQYDVHMYMYVHVYPRSDLVSPCGSPDRVLPAFCFTFT